MKRFRFNRELLNFSEERRSLAGWVGKFFKYLFASIIAALLYLTLFSLLFDSNKAAMLREESKMLKSEFGSLQQRMELLEGNISYLKERDRELYRLIFNAEPPATYETVSSEEYYYQMDTTDFEQNVENISKVIENLSLQAAQISELLGGIEVQLRKIGKSATNLPSIVPLEGFMTDQTGASFGNKINPFYKTVRKHGGIDLLAQTGTFVLASADGTVSEVKRKDRVLGNYIVIDHHNGYKTKYCYLGEILVPKGRVVKQGGVIAKVGLSGMSFAPHLHYEVHFLEEEIDPMNFFFADLAPEVIRDMMVTSINTGQSLD